MGANLQAESLKIPSAMESERGLIAAVIDNDARRADGGAEYEDVIALAGGSGLTECFEIDSHRRLWSLLCERHADGKTNDLVDVIEACRVAGVEFAQGLLSSEITAWIEAYLRQAEGSYRGLAKAYAREVRETAEKRLKIREAYEILQRIGNDRAPLSLWLENAAAELGKTSTAAQDSATPIDRDLDATMARAAELQRGLAATVPGVPSGINALDELTGGLRPGRVTLIGGRTSQGKSALAVTIATHAAQLGKRVVYVSLEMQGSELSERVLSQLSGVPAVKIWRGPINAVEMALLSRAAQFLRGLPLRVIDNENDWPAVMARLQREISLGCDLVVIDYLQLLQIKGAKKLDDWQKLGRITAEVKGLALRAQVPILTVAQLNREAAKESRPRLHHLRGSGDLEQDADAVVLIYRQTDGDGKPVGERAELMLEKNRGGRTGVANVNWDGPLMRFHDIGLPEPEEDRRYV